MSDDDDIIETLRSRAAWWQRWIDGNEPAEFECSVENMQHEQDTDLVAADEIERLRRELAEWVATADATARERDDLRGELAEARAEICGNLTIMGSIMVKEPDGAEIEHKMALLIDFDSPEQIRKAIEAGRCSFSFGNKNAAAIDAAKGEP